jgi:hypothetical protein
MNRIFSVLVLLAAVILGAFWYVHRARTRALNSGAVFIREPGGKPAPLPPAAAPSSQPATQPALATQPPPAAVSGAQAPAAASPATPVAAPASDTIARNPPNGMLFTASGKYQLYRQGDITWRLNTDTGWACVLFATDAQWRRPRVYQDGCRAFAESTPARGY